MITRLSSKQDGGLLPPLLKGTEQQRPLIVSVLL